MKYLSLLVVAALAFTSTTADAARFISNSGGQAVPGSYIVVLKDSSTVDSFQPKFNNLVARQNARGGRRPKINHRFKNIHGFTLTGSRTTLNELLNMDEVDYIEEDSIVTIDKTQTSPPSWGLGRVSSRTLTGNGKSYKYYASGGKGVTVYVVDTGINTAHADFGGRAKMGKNYIQGSPNTDENGHGTHVAGTIGGTQYGVAKRVNLVGVKVLSKTGTGSTSGIVAALDWIATASKGKKAVVNMSLGGNRSQALNDAVARVHKAGIPVIVAAGNEQADACSKSPASADKAFTVAASDRADRLASFSNYGRCVNIFGPGVEINSAWIGSKNAKRMLQGTSMASPHVAGVAALYIGQSTTKLSTDAVYKTLRSTATKNVLRGSLKGSVNLMVFNGAGK